jgi:ABC-type bacteriocin/lantibiotic exporter with double-glycine peptidase domain
MRGRTTFLIAHRLSTLQDCDLLARIENGRLVEVRADVAAAIEEALAPVRANGAGSGSTADV